MAIRGRKPRSVEQRMAEGNAGKRPLPEPVSVGGIPTPTEAGTPPDHLPEYGKQWWRENVPRLAALGIVDRIDMSVLERLATLWARAQQASDVVASEGHFARGSTGQLVEHPALKIERDSTKLFLSMAEQYALTPVARTRLGLAELNRRSLAQELADALGGDDDDGEEFVDEVEVPDDVPADAEVVEE